jgi:hypothetical protein
MSCELRFRGESYGWEAQFFERGDTWRSARVVCEICANFDDKRVKTGLEEFTKRYKRSNNSKRVDCLDKTLDHGIGVRIPASQPIFLSKQIDASLMCGRHCAAF